MGIVDDQHRAAEEEWMAAWLAGPMRTTYETLPPQVGDPAPDVELPDGTRAKRRLSEFWEGRPALVIFLRHFGCACLAERWEQLQEQIPDFEEAGAAIVAVGQGEPERTAAVAERRGYSFPILCDPERRVYELYGLLEGPAAAILHDFDYSPGDRAAGEELFTSRRETERALVDNPWQLPGEFVVADDGTLVHAHRYQYCEDFPPKTVLLGAIGSAKGRA